MVIVSNLANQILCPQSPSALVLSLRRLRGPSGSGDENVAFYARRRTTIFGISGYVKLVTLYCHAIFWGTEGLAEGCVKIMQIVSCSELMANLFIFIDNGGI